MRSGPVPRVPTKPYHDEAFTNAGLRHERRANVGASPDGHDVQRWVVGMGKARRSTRRDSGMGVGGSCFMPAM